MWSAGCKASLYIAANYVVLVRAGQAPLFWSGEPWRHGLYEAAEVLRRNRIGKIAVWLSGGMARPFLVPMVQGIKRWGDVEQLAIVLAPEVTKQEVPLNVWIGRWHEDASTLAVATEQALQQALVALKASHGLNVCRMSPVWRWAATQESEGKPLVLLHESDACTALRFKNGAPLWVTSHIPPPALSGLKSFAVRTAFNQGLDTSQVISAYVDVDFSTAEVEASQGNFANVPPVKLCWSGNNS